MHEPETAVAGNASVPAATMVQTAWNHHKRWSRAASRLKKRLLACRSGALWLAIVGAVLQTAAATRADEDASLRTALAGCGAVALAAATFITTRFLNGGLERQWITSRSVSEALKKEVHVRLAEVPPYEAADAAARLANKVEELLKRGEVAARAVAAIEMRQEATPPSLRDAETYIAQRLDKQVTGYYRPQAKRLEWRLRVYWWTELTLSGVATLLGALATVQELPGVSAWVAAVTAAGLAVSAHISASRLEREVLSYTATADQLELLRERWRNKADRGTDEERRRLLVERSENIISIENQGWMTDRPGEI